MKSLESKREEYLLEFAKNVTIMGFTLDAAEKASVCISGDIFYYLTLFPSGLSEIATYYEEYSLTKLIDNLGDPSAIKGVTNKIEIAIKRRIIENPFSKEFTAAISQFYFKPQNTPIAIKASWKLCDAIWNWAGDQSTDYNYYTKRSLLFSVYNSAILYYLRNNDENTSIFISKSLKKIASIGKAKSKIKSMIPKLENIPILRMFL
jgi:ubiquinone biosynthesis protein COQ9